MGRIPDAGYWTPIAGGIVLACFVLAKIDAVRFRKRAVEVSGEVLKIFNHRQHTSYFIRYEYDGSTRVAEYAGLPLVRELKVGERLQILIDGTAPPDASLPGTFHNAKTQTGYCRLPGQPLISAWDIVVVGICVYVIVRYFARQGF